ncbi:flagellar basal body P-ring formation chaperone FlgA [Rhodoplanes sp. Z2-YC6860]|uniref:flagellar basal body P-ring formation chaperone FlgA n=1 Tax=Rhodoplanes sp. Z2-YC6860 TaxID=674703 RepID=UPI00078CCD6A|nr:flagellar basal body P-ring formation chaperone FlgA [Rhodoplanes sp. Z2-YC6860]AMN43299.1 flagellar basal-body P-ring formation protein FlgA [Rhodoplanes sp. Z2-YC6860]
MIRITATAFALLLALGHEAAAGAAADARIPRLRELVTVTSDIVCIGDLIDNAGKAADVPVFRAPDLGQTGAVLVQRVTDALRPYDLTDIDTGGLSEVVVTRLSRPISSKDVADRIAQALAGQYGFGDAQNISITFDRDVRMFHVEANATSDLVVSRMNADPRTGRFDVSFELPGSAAARRIALRFVGTAREMMEVATLTRSLRQGEVIKGSDVTIERKPKTEAGLEAVSPEQAIGMAVKSPSRAGQILRQSELVRPLAVQRSETVTIGLEMPGIMLSVRGKANEAGAVGDVISVLNIQSNRTVQATVTGPGRVTVAPSTPLVATVVSSLANDQSARNTQ